MHHTYYGECYQTQDKAGKEGVHTRTFFKFDMGQA
jgi:hypothetical protein